jgi:hypothetical protein
MGYITKKSTKREVGSSPVKLLAGGRARARARTRAWAGEARPAGPREEVVGLEAELGADDSGKSYSPPTADPIRGVVTQHTTAYVVCKSLT